MLYEERKHTGSPELCQSMAVQELMNTLFIDTEIALAASPQGGWGACLAPRTQLYPFWFVSDVISLDLGVHSTAPQNKQQPAFPLCPGMDIWAGAAVWKLPCSVTLLAEEWAVQLPPALGTASRPFPVAVTGTSRQHKCCRKPD